MRKKAVKKNKASVVKLSVKTKSNKTISNKLELLEKIRWMTMVIQDSNDAIIFQDLNGNILAWNHGAEKIYGHSEVEALSMNIAETIPIEYQEEARKFITSLKNGELVLPLEAKRKTKYGKIVDMLITHTKLITDKGMLAGIVTTGRDITERKQSEAGLREKFRELEYLREGQIALSERMRGEQNIFRLGQIILRHLVPFTNAQVGAFYLVSSEKKLKRICGHAFRKTEGIEKNIEFGEGLIGQAASEKRSLLIKNVPENYFNKIHSDLGEMSPKSLLIFPIIYENEVNGVIELGSFYSFSEYQRAFLDHVSESIGIAINSSIVHKKVQNLLERFKALNAELQAQQAELKVANKELESAVNVRDEFMSIAGHELKTPLTFLKLQSEIRKRNLEKENITAFTNEKLLKMFDSDHKQIERITRLIDDMIDVSRISSGKLSMNLEEFDICPLVYEVVERHHEQLIFSGNKIEISSVESVYGRWDKFRLEQVITNLLTNAIRYGPGKIIKIKIGIEQNEAVIVILDQGIGIAEENLARIFLKFERVTGMEVGGLGLGLYIVAQIIEAHHGSIKVESQLGQGSSFTIKLPLTL